MEESFLRRSIKKVEQSTMADFLRQDNTTRRYFIPIYECCYTTNAREHTITLLQASEAVELTSVSRRSTNCRISRPTRCPTRDASSRRSLLLLQGCCSIGHSWDNLQKLKIPRMWLFLLLAWSIMKKRSFGWGRPGVPVLVSKRCRERYSHKTET